MNWIIASLLMFLSSVALYLCVRKSNALRTPQQLNNLAMFLIPVLVYIFLTLKTPVSFSLSPIEYAIIAVQGIFFSYLGNKFSLKGIELSPNPGFSLILSKSYVVFTAVTSVFIFSAPLTLQSIFAIGLIIAFSALIMIDPYKSKKNVKSAWLIYSIGAFFCWSFLALSSKYLLNAGVPILTRLILSMTVTTIFIFLEILYKNISLKDVSQKQLSTLVLIGIFGASFNYFMQVGFDLAPNVGFVNAANAASISLLTLMSAIFFKDELTIKKTVGVVGVTAGLLLLFL